MSTIPELPTHYRLRDIATGPGVEVYVERYIAVAETPQGYWVVWDVDHTPGRDAKFHKDVRRWVPKLSPRFCSPDMEAAVYSFKRRKAIQLKKLKWQLEQCRQAIRGVEALGASTFPGRSLDCGVPAEWQGLRWE